MIRVVPSQQTGFIVFAVFIFDIEVYKSVLFEQRQFRGMELNRTVVSRYLIFNP